MEIEEHVLDKLIRHTLAQVEMELEDWEPSKSDLEMGEPAADLHSYKFLLEEICKITEKKFKGWEKETEHLNASGWRILRDATKVLLMRVDDLLYKYDPAHY